MDKLTYQITRLLSMYSTRIMAAILLLSISTVGIYNMVDNSTATTYTTVSVSTKANMDKL